MKQELPQQVINELKAGRKISAIKLLREEQGVGLKEAKETLETYIEANAEVKETFDANQNNLSQESVLKLVVVIVFTIIGYYFYQK